MAFKTVIARDPVYSNTTIRLQITNITNSVLNN
jgi:hypothetical protein